LQSSIQHNQQLKWALLHVHAEMARGAGFQSSVEPLLFAYQGL